MCAIKLFFFRCSDTSLDLHSFPTRRSSDLILLVLALLAGLLSACDAGGGPKPTPTFNGTIKIGVASPFTRSEEHTSELQSRRDLVCRLLLEKKKNRTTAAYVTYVTAVGTWG